MKLIMFLLLFLFFPAFLFSQDLDIQMAGRSLGNINKSNLIQLNLDKMQPNKTSIPFKGSLLVNLEDIKKAYRLKNVDLVKASLESLKKNNPNHFSLEGYLLLGAVYDQERFYSQSVNVYDEALKKTQNETQIPFLLNKSQVLRHWNKQNESIKILQRIDSERYGKKFPQIFYYLGLAYLYLKDHNGAILNLRKYLENAPKTAPQVENVKRAIAWLLLSQSSMGAQVSNENTEKMLQMLADRQQENLLNDSTQANVSEKSLDIKHKDLEEGEDFDVIAD